MKLLQSNFLSAKIKSHQNSDRFIQTLSVRRVSKTHLNFKANQPQISILMKMKYEGVVLMIVKTYFLHILDIRNITC